MEKQLCLIASQLVSKALVIILCKNYHVISCQEHTVDCEDDEFNASQGDELGMKQMQEQDPMETILHSRLESNGDLKYLIRWVGEYNDSCQPKSNNTSDIIEEFRK